MTTQDQQVKCTDRSASSDLKKSKSFENMHDKQQGHSTGEVAESDKIDHESYSIMEKQSNSAGDISSSYDQPKISRSQSFEFQMNNSNDLEGSTNSAEILGPRYRSFEDLCSVGDGARHSELTLVVQFAEPSCDVYVTSNMEENVSVVRSDAAEEGERSNTSSGYDEIRDEMHKHGYWKDKSVCSNRSVGPVSPYTDSGDFCHHSDNGDGLNKAMGRESEYAGHNQQSLEVYDSKEISPEAEWEEPETDGVDFEPKLQHNKYMYSDCSELTPRAFSIKRIEDWINQIDIENGVVVEEQEQRSNSALLKDSEPVAGMPTMRHDAKSPLGMEIAYNYISGLAPASSSAQLANLGLVAIPILSAFAGLRLLNLAGNSIVRITAGVLPKGLHMLNLSKNSISTIEGLRELTRLRVLDLSYNRIARIGHGLASCSSLKELYLAGNKISEVDGLHRLLKLKILDVRNNKISTSKGLGQLAANYNSLEAVNVEGNPAQKNVGDEHLKKYLLGLLPHLAYYNKQSARSSSSKDVSDRHARIISSSCRSDRAVRSERKSSRSVAAAAAAAAAHTSQSSWRARSSRASSSLLKPSRTRTDVANPMQRIRSKG